MQQFPSDASVETRLELVATMLDRAVEEVRRAMEEIKKPSAASRPPAAPPIDVEEAPPAGGTFFMPRLGDEPERRTDGNA